MLSLKQQVKGFLEESGYTTFEYHGCFDIAAKKNALLLLKVLLNVDAFQEEQARNLKIISNNLDGYPMLVGVQTNIEKLKEGVVYERFEMPTLSIKTFEELVCNGIFPRVYRDRGGLYVEVDSEVLKNARTRKSMTQRELAEAVGVNKKVIYEHEKRHLRMLLDIAERLERLLNEKIITDAKVFNKYEGHGRPSDALGKNINRNFEKMGFRTDFVSKSPMDFFAKENVLIVSDIEVNKRKMEKRAADLKDLIRVVKKPALLITEDSKEEELGGIQLVDRRELADMEKKELIKRAKKSNLTNKNT